MGSRDRCARRVSVEAIRRNPLQADVHAENSLWAYSEGRSPRARRRWSSRRIASEWFQRPAPVRARGPLSHRGPTCMKKSRATSPKTIAVLERYLKGISGAVPRRHGSAQSAAGFSRRRAGNAQRVPVTGSGRSSRPMLNAGGRAPRIAAVSLAAHAQLALVMPLRDAISWPCDLVAPLKQSLAAKRKALEAARKRATARAVGLPQSPTLRLQPHSKPPSCTASSRLDVLASERPEKAQQGRTRRSTTHCLKSRPCHLKIRRSRFTS